jgi:hypothetical protein
LAHELAHAIIDHYLIVQPPKSTAEILARYTEEHVFYYVQFRQKDFSVLIVLLVKWLLNECFLPQLSPSYRILRPTTSSAILERFRFQIPSFDNETVEKP